MLRSILRGAVFRYILRSCCVEKDPSYLPVEQKLRVCHVEKGFEGVQG